MIIVNWNMREDIRLCLDSLYNDLKDLNDLNVCVHVVDNSSNGDGIRKMLSAEFPQAVYIDGEGNYGFGRAQNLGIRYAPAKYYFILNPDIKFNQGKLILSQLFNYMEANIQIGMVGPKLLNFDGTLQYSCYRFPRFFDPPIKRLNADGVFPFLKGRIYKFLMVDFDHESERPVDWIMGSAMFVRYSAIVDVGVFDDRYFMYFEDCDWCRRMWERFWQVRYLPDVVLYHKHRRDSAKVPGMVSIIKNPLTRIHIASWLRYFWKWKFKSKRYYDI